MCRREFKLAIMVYVLDGNKNSRLVGMAFVAEETVEGIKAALDVLDRWSRGAIRARCRSAVTDMCQGMFRCESFLLAWIGVR